MHRAVDSASRASVSSHDLAAECTALLSMKSIGKWLLIGLLYLVTLLVTAVVCFYSVIILAGPHGGLLPDAFQPAVLIAAWLILIVLPPVLTSLAAKRLSKELGR